MTTLHDRKYHAEPPHLELLQTRTDRVCAIGCVVVLIVVVVLAWIGLVMH